MPNKSGLFLKSKPPGSTVSSSLYSGIASAQREIRKPGPRFAIRSNQSKHLSEQIVSFPSPSVQYHPWESKYNQIFTREKIKKSMTKDPYSQKRRLIAQANENITTEEECSPSLIPANAIHIKKPIIRGETKSLLPKIVRYLRSNEVMPSERFLSQIQTETKTPLPMIGTNKNNTIATDRLLNRAKMRNDALVIRRPPRRLILNSIHETISPLAVCG